MFGESNLQLAVFCANISRLILYFPVSALVTLFGNILQNPADPRARSDVRLMNLVVNFLSLLVTEEENGGVKRMLGVCSEFERIAKIVLDKADKDSSSRRKRKNNEEQAGKTKGPVPHTPMQAQHPAMASVFSPGLQNAINVQAGYGTSPMPNGSPNAQNWNADFTNGGEYMTPNANGGMTPFADMQAYPNGNDMSSPMNVFQQPFVPQDLWQMPMSLEYDWADMTGGQYPSFENGLIGEPLLQNNNQHLQNQQMR